MPIQKEINFQITTIGVIKVVAVLLALFFLFLIKDLIIILFVSFVFAAALSPIVNKWEEKGVSRALSLVLIYLVLFLILALIISSFLPEIINQFKEIIQNFSPYFQQASEPLPNQGMELKGDLQGFLDSLNNIFIGKNAGVFSNIINLFGGFGTFIFILIITFYLVLDKKSIRNLFYSLTPLKYQNYFIPYLKKAQEKIGLWFKGQLTLSFIIGLVSYLGLLVIGVRYALVLGLFAGLTEIIPYLGPWIGAVPAVLIAFFQAPIKALVVAVFYLLVQQLENVIIVPRVMSKAVGLNPIIIICSLWVGGRISGILGMLIAVPVAGILSVIVKDYIEFKKIN
ncbi:MAG: hypothetical protein Athens101410_250 [Parcubacteria group bacterium Athens1014_10]|nr:MAG: hypothetical protein Athens101410_250 [Parcubacteria group bacterium Athens1014_10]TSD05524.1 MAG: hypothetical protein Athens071412_334 [Parcubacteria group bacterium Athens0714_12]